jgi:hypothetical protein
MNKKATIAISLSLALFGANSAAAAPVYPPVPGTGPSARAVISFSETSSNVSSRFLPRLSALEISGKSVITITGYARKSKSSTADRKLGLERARATQKIMKTIAPKAKYVIVSKGSIYNAACKAFSNRCSVVTVQN